MLGLHGAGSPVGDDLGPCWTMATIMPAAGRPWREGEGRVSVGHPAGSVGRLLGVRPGRHGCTKSLPGMPSSAIRSERAVAPSSCSRMMSA